MRAVIGLYEAIDAHLGKPYHQLMRHQIAQFVETEAGLHRALGDRAAMRRSWWKAVQMEPSWKGRLAICRKLWL